MDSIEKIQNKIIEEFLPIDDWLDKYDHIVKLARQRAPMPEELKNDASQLPGCQSQVWITADNVENRVIFKAESDSAITNGIIALLLRVFNNQSPEDIANADLFFLKEIGISASLSPSRSNGVASIMRRFKQLAHLFVTPS